LLQQLLNQTALADAIENIDIGGPTMVVQLRKTMLLLVSL
jgi:AICAR transformylase/IMP cyclohydrolase PurH